MRKEGGKEGRKGEEGACLRAGGSVALLQHASDDVIDINLFAL